MESALRRGYWRVAIRRFLILQACELEVPDHVHQEMSALMAACPAADLRRMTWQVGAWRSLRSARGQRS
jgi:hypothetical protein